MRKLDYTQETARVKHLQTIIVNLLHENGEFIEHKLSNSTVECFVGFTVSFLIKHWCF